jgi:sugar phosphate permease
MKNQTLSNDILMRLIKIFDIGYIAVLYILFAIILSLLVDRTIGKFDEEEESKKSFLHISIEMLLTVWFYGVIIYIVRNIVALIPYPLDGYHGFNHMKVKELGSASLFTFTFILFCDYFKRKVLFFYDRFLEITKGES